MNRFFRILVICLGLASLAPFAGAQEVQAHSPEGVYPVRAPFDGTVNKFNYNSVHPYNHQLPFGGDWSTDYYAPAGTAVYANIGHNRVPYISPRLKVTAVRAGCASGLVSSGGYLITVGVYSPYNGSYIGEVDYMHLDRPSVSVGQTIAYGQRLGYLRQWTYSRCYSVTNPGGVHLHIEAYNAHHYSCYTISGYAQTLSSGTTMGFIGADDPGYWDARYSKRYGDRCDRAY